MDAAAEAARGLRRVINDGSHNEQQRAAAEKRQQLWFTAGAALTSSLMLFSLTYETRWISAYLGKTQFEAYSIAHSAVFYLKPLRNLWSGITSKVARAIGQRDDLQISKLMKMCVYVTGIAFVLTWTFYLPFGPWLLKSVYKADDDIYPCAQQSPATRCALHSHVVQQLLFVPGYDRGISHSCCDYSWCSSNTDQIWRDVATRRAAVPVRAHARRRLGAVL